VTEGSGAGREELERLLEELLVELGRRESIAAGLEGELRRGEERLREVVGASGVRRGDTRRLIAAEQLRRRIRTELTGVRKRLAEAVVDVERARERRGILEEELRRAEEDSD
jgi:hypothetical protein